MAARKLHMPGARERIVGSAGAGAVAEGVVVQNGNGGCLQQPPGGSRYETRLATPTVHPLPLASRYVGAMPDSLRPASAALQSTWIQRLRPTSPDVSSRELAHEVAHVWRDPKPPLWNPITPLLLAAPPKEPLLLQPYYREQQQQVDDSGDKRVTVREPVIAPKIIVKTECLDINTSKGWERSQVRVTTGFQTTSAAGQWKHENSWSAPVKPSGFVSNIKGSVVVEGAVRRQGMDSPLEGNSAALMPSSHPLAVNGVSGALVTGFGPLRVVLKPTVGGNMNKSIAAGCSSKLKGPVVEGIQAGDGPSAGAHLVTPIDRNIVKYPAGTQMVTWVAAANTNSTGKFSPDRNMDCEQVGQSSRPGQLFGGGGLVPSKRTGYGSDICKPLFIRPPQPGVRDRTFGCPVNANGNRYEGGFSPVGEVHPMSQTLKGWFPTFSGGGVDMAGRGVAPNQSFATIVSKEGRNDYGQQQEGKYLNRTNPDPSGKQVFGANGIEVRKAKEVMGVAVDRSHVDVGRPQSQGSALSPPFAPYQPSSHMLHIKQQPMSFSPARSPPYRGEEETGTGDEARNDTQERAELKPPFVPPKLPLEGTEGTSGKSAWSSVFAVYKGSNPTGEPQNSNFSSGNLPIDGRPRLHEGQNSVRSRSGGPRASGNQDNENGGSARHIAHAGASSPEVRSQFDNQSSHFSSSPWPVDDGHNPTDDAGSAFGSQASHTPSSPAPRAVQAPGTHLKGQEVSRYRYDLGGSSIVGSKDVSFKRARSKEHSGSQSPGMRNPSGRPEGLRGPRNLDEENHASGVGKSSRAPPMPTLSGQKDDTCGSSPPSLPPGYNNAAEMCTAAFPGAAFEDRGKNRVVNSRTVNVESENDGMHFRKRQQGNACVPTGFASRRERSELQGHNILRGRRDLRDPGARPCNDAEAEEAQPMGGEAFREMGSKFCGPSDTGESGQKQSRLRSISDAVGEAGTSGPAKRSRLHPNQNSWDLVESSGLPSRADEETGVGTDKRSSWVARWLPAGSVGPNASNSAKRTDGQWNGFSSTYLENGRNNVLVGFPDRSRAHLNRPDGHVKRMGGNASEPRNNIRDLTGSKRSVFGLPPFHTPSAAAMALVGTAARKVPSSSQRRGPIAMWPQVQLQTTPPPEVRSSELPTYVEQ